MAKTAGILTATLGAAAFCVAWNTSAAAQQATVEGPRVSWDYSIWGPPRVASAGIEALARHVQERTGGRFTIRIHYGGALSAGPDNLDNIKLGAFQMATICTSYHPGKNPGLTVLDLPFLPLSDRRVHWRVHMAVYNHPYIVEEFRRWNAGLVLSILQPQSELMGRGRPIERLEDFRGRRIRALGGTGEALRRLGAVPTTMQATEVYNALERGIIDAVAFPFTYSFAAYRINEISSWYTTNLAPGANNCPSVVNLNALNRLPPQYRQLIEEGKEKAFEALVEAQTAAEQRDLAAWRQAGLREITYGQDVLDEIRRVGGQPVWDEWVRNMERQGVPGRELLDLVLNKAREYSQQAQR
ncbi:C4-dicarboxylate ABC transporter substrate-binding protein [Caldovatus sediminis]|uniref:C4-dicarboxylate ABC transporter substrate-binding protein n=1 Tax=Caldovatus sediminis TaxID=2041189 RepID=A0A8J2ZCM1_9PROT|nr:TRAP transporter substrate-binding protein DctP [Caldovatus sediminis]GGG38093.1 C4-dicarboxylate ABC transporter substrate-binding protein [Caldovatus sediminis]